MKTSQRKVCIVIPTKNEESFIQEIITNIFSILEEYGFYKPTIIVVDDSKDKTKQLATEVGATVINGGGKGLGFAMYQGLKYALNFNPDYILSCDADGQADLNEIPMFFKPLENLSLIHI